MLNIEEAMSRDTLLVEGRLTQDGEFWFNEDIATMFCIKLNTKINVGATSFKWINSKREIVDINIDDAKKYAAEIMDTLDLAYLV